MQRATHPPLARRDFLASTGLALSALLVPKSTPAEEPRKLLPVAGVVTVYRENSHADVILGKILGGYDQQGGPGPALKLASLYCDQKPEGDLSRGLAEKYGFRLADSIDDALTFGSDRLQVAGVISIGEHGDYPLTPDTKQRMYPRRRFFDAIADAFERVHAVAPLFNDKHLAYRWEDAQHMATRATALKIPLLAGSPLPVAWRRPRLSLPVGCKLQEVLAVGYGPLEDYGFHALEMLQCMAERRTGGESGVASVRFLEGAEIAAAEARGEWSGELFDAALSKLPGMPRGDLSGLKPGAAFFQLQYRDGLRATVAMANGIASKFAFAARLAEQKEPLATWFELEERKPYGHFGYLLRAIERHIQMGRPPYPLERTLLTTGVLDALMQSRLAPEQWRKTPELAIAYEPTDWPFANWSENP